MKIIKAGNLRNYALVGTCSFCGAEVACAVIEAARKNYQPVLRCPTEHDGYQCSGLIELLRDPAAETASLQTPLGQRPFYPES